MQPFFLCTTYEYSQGRQHSSGEHGKQLLFALLVHRSSVASLAQRAAEILRNGSQLVHETAARRLRWLESTPQLISCRHRRWLNKAISIMRLNTLAPEGLVRTEWAVSDRVPHGPKGFLWDTCFHSVARSLLDAQKGYN